MTRIPLTIIPPTPLATTGRKQVCRWKPGRSGNPAGRAQGSRHRAHVALDAIGQDAAEDILHAVIREAKAGDMRAAEIILARIWPAPRGRHVRLTLPEINSAADLTRALTTIITATSSGEITPDEANIIASVLETTRRAMELGNIEERLNALENK
ncbi:MAG: hypothetical protein JWR10_855 [Rubritepida sp.]|nr:hypothetical protein [Rubritepida sp.]